jgi:hypothetical protein
MKLERKLVGLRGGGDVATSPERGRKLTTTRGKKIVRVERGLERGQGGWVREKKSPSRKRAAEKERRPRSDRGRAGGGRQMFGEVSPEALADITGGRYEYELGAEGAQRSGSGSRSNLSSTGSPSRTGRNKTGHKQGAWVREKRR